jgi:hypothetical protein
MTTLADAFVRLRPDGKQLGPELKQQTERAGADAGTAAGHTFGRSMAKAIKAAAIGLAIGAAAGGVKAFQFLKQATTDASDLNETVSASQAIFPKSQKALQAFAATAATTVGLSKQEAIAGAVAFGNFFNQIGIGEKQIAKMTLRLIQLSADHGSIRNADTAQVMAAFSRRPAAYDAADVPADHQRTTSRSAMRISHKRNAQDLTDAEKRRPCNLALKGQGKALGNFAATSQEMANQQRSWKSNLTDIRGEIGGALLPVVTRFYAMLNSQLAPALRELWAQHGPQVTAFLSGLPDKLNQIGPILTSVVDKVKAFFSSAQGGGGDGLGASFASAAGPAAARTGRRSSSPRCSLSDLVSVGATVLGFLADHTDELTAAMPYLVGAVIAYKVAQLAANVAAAVAVPTKLAEIVTNRQLVRSNQALIASRAGLTATTATGTAATVVNTGAENAGIFARGRAVLSMVAQRVASVAVRGATLAWTAVQWLLNAALTANPIGLIVLGIAALIAGIILAYRNSEVFRKIVQAAFRGIQIAAKFVVDWFVQTAWPFLQKVWTGIVAGVKFLVDMWKFYFNLARSIVSAVLAWVTDYVRGRIAVIVSHVRAVVAVYQHFRDAFQRARDAIIEKVALAIIYVKGIPGRIKAALSNLGSALYEKGKDLIQGFINGIKEMGGKVRDTLVGLLPEPLKKFAATLGLASPSKLTYRYGWQTAEGFILGLHSQQGAITAAMARLVDPARFAQPHQPVAASTTTAAAPWPMTFEDLVRAFMAAMSGMALNFDGRKVGELTGRQADIYRRA